MYVIQLPCGNEIIYYYKLLHADINFCEVQIFVNFMEFLFTKINNFIS